MKLIPLVFTENTQKHNENTRKKTEKNIFQKISPKVKEMDLTEFQKIISEYLQVVRLQDQYRFLRYMVKEKETIKQGTEKIDIMYSIMEYQIRNMNLEMKDFVDGACFFLEKEVIQYILEKGYGLHQHEFHCYSYQIPLFRASFFHFQKNNANEINTEKQKQIFKLLIEHGALLEVCYHSFWTDEVKINILETAKEEEVFSVLDWIKEFHHVFNPEQKKQWQKLRLSAIF